MKLQNPSTPTVNKGIEEGRTKKERIHVNGVQTELKSKEKSV
jgi:hypothetical protein